jgi:hypothetical protein
MCGKSLVLGRTRENHFSVGYGVGPVDRMCCELDLDVDLLEMKNAMEFERKQGSSKPSVWSENKYAANELDLS